MVFELLVRYMHFISIIMVAGAIFSEFFLLKKEMLRSEIQLLAKIDGLYGLSSIALLAAGFTLWFGVGKGSAFYSENPIFLVKIGLAILLGILSIYPTIFFLKNRKGDNSETVIIPKTVRVMVVAEVVILLFIPLLAVLMARGYGL